MTFPILPSNSATGADIYGRSLRFNSADSAYLNRTPASAGNRRTWTWSGWVKLGYVGAATIFSQAASQTERAWFSATSDSALRLILTASGVAIATLTTAAVYRDPSAWYHIVLSVDTTQAVDSSRIKIYVNGDEVTSFTTAIYCAQNTDTYVNSTESFYIGAIQWSSSNYFSGYLTEINFIDGQALDASYFGATNATTGQWEPKAYSGAYGTNGFYLNFKNNATVSALGTDYSGNGNNWTPNNFSVTAGAGNDSMWDYPANVDDGGNGRGNYPTLNPLFVSTAVLSDGNLFQTGINSGRPSTIAIPTTGKWYFETTVARTAIFGNTYGGQIGVIKAESNVSTYAALSTWTDGGIYKNGSQVQSISTTVSVGDIVGIAYDADTLSFQAYKNGATFGTAITLDSGVYLFYVVGNGTSTSDGVQHYVNFGQRPFAYTPPSGFKALNTQNLPSPTIAKGNTQFSVLTWTGADTGTSRSFTGVGFKPDLVWTKARSVGYNHILQDVLRGSGANTALCSNSTDGEGQPNTNTSSYGYLSSYNVDGFTWNRGSFGSGTNPDGYAFYDELNTTYVAWNWKANGAGVTNTAGTITSTVSANTTSGFSVVTYTGTGSNATVGHGLGVAPSMVVVKNRISPGNNWCVWHRSIGASQFLYLNATDAVGTWAPMFNGTIPTATVFSVGTDGQTNYSGNTYVAYCFAAIPGYSAFGSYTGNGSADGPFVYTGFRPAFVMIKVSSTTNDWVVLDSSRDPYNVSMHTLYPDLSVAEEAPATSVIGIDLVANGFKIRDSKAFWNASSATYIFAAFAESPFKFANAR